MINSRELTTHELDEIGLRALLKALGPMGMVRFLRQHQRGRGDYTKERHEWLDKVSSKDFTQAIFRRQRSRKRQSRPIGLRRTPRES
jgi:hypothetical protein